MRDDPWPKSAWTLARAIDEAKRVGGAVILGPDGIISPHDPLNDPNLLDDGEVARHKRRWG